MTTITGMICDNLYNYRHVERSRDIAEKQCFAFCQVNEMSPLRYASVDMTNSFSPSNINMYRIKKLNFALR